MSTVAVDRERVEQLAAEVGRRHGCHTAILYGSWARGDATAQSDIDVLCLREAGPSLRDARNIDGTYMDAFVYQQSELATIAPELLRLVGGVVLFEREGCGRQLLERVEALRARGPERLPDDERNARVVWARKMLDRIARGRGAEASYRRMYLLVQALEDYFALRDRWFLGSKEAFAWLQTNDPRTNALFEAAFSPNATHTCVVELVRAVYEAT